MGQNAPAALEEDTVIQDKNQEKEQPQKSILCRQCGHIITSHSLAVQPHENTFRNPAGYSSLFQRRTWSRRGRRRDRVRNMVLGLCLELCSLPEM